MTELSTGIYGAQRQTWRRTSPRDLLKRMLDENPDDSQARLMQRFSIRVQENPDMLDSIIEYWFTNNHRSLTRVTDRERDVREQSALVKTAENLIRSRAETLVLSDMVLPNGKPLKSATGQECATFAPKVGGLLAKIAKKLKPAQIVGEVLNERQLRKIYDNK